MVSSQWALPTSRGALRSSPPKLSRRERVLVSLVFVLGAAVWFLGLVGPGRSAPKGPTLPQKTTSVIDTTDYLAAVEPRRLTDTSGLEDPGTLDAPSHTHIDTLTTNQQDLGPLLKPQSPDALRIDAPKQRSSDTHTLSWLNSLKEVQSVQQNGVDLSPRHSQTQESTEVWWPETVAELIEDVRANGAPSSRPANGKGFHFYPVKEEYNLTTQAFTRRYGYTYGSQPVKIKNSQSDWWKPEDWTLEAVREQVGDISVFRKTKKCAPGKKNRSHKNCHRVKEKDPAKVGISWAAMVSVDVEEEGIETYNDLFDKQIELSKEGRYLYAQEVGPRWLLDFTQRLRQPKYFMNNVVDVDRDNHPDPLETLSDNIFPAFFFGPEGSQSPLHTDVSMTRFWILELSGTKLIRLVPPNNNWRLDATDDDDFQPKLFTADILVPDFEKHPNLDGLIVYETLLEPGDLLYIPEGWAHQALNLDWTCMTSYNYNDDNNLANRLTFYEHDKPERLLDTELRSNHFFLPLVNMSTDVGNTDILEFIRIHSLEYASVSDAARNHIEKLKTMGLKPHEWMDYYSRPVMQVAVSHNYLALAKWLVEEGVPLKNDTQGRFWLKAAEHQFKLRAMSEWMREHMGVEASDDLSDIDLELTKAVLS